MPGPPPPPPPNMPGPPPPPMTNLSNVKKLGGSSSGGDNRNALLSQIQKGTKLKKVTTVDKSGPIVSGRVAGSSNKISSPPKQQSLTKSSPESATSSPIRQGGFTNLAEELQHKLTLKKNKNSPLKESRSIIETKESSPPSTITTTTTSSKSSFLNEIKSKQSVISPQHQYQQPSTTSVSSKSTPIVNDAIPNKSSLFNNNNNNNNNNNASSNISNNIRNSSSYDNKSQPSAPRINHGKPNLAPKPPPQLSLAINTNNNNNNNNNSINDVSRKAVARHQSMKSPRSPPVVPMTGPINTDNHFGTMRNPISQNKTQEALNLQIVQKPIAQRPTNRPPPPPVPNRQLGTNLTSQSHAKSTTALNNTSNSDQILNAPKRTIPSSGSTNNINSIERNIDVADANAPPLPPHRSSSAQKSQQSLNIQVPPEVPRRGSSMKNSLDLSSSNKYSSPNPNQQTAPKLVVDLEARYSLLFHSMSELPPPKPFLNVPKSYPSKAVRPNGI